MLVLPAVSHMVKDEDFVLFEKKYVAQDNKVLWAYDTRVLWT